MKQENITKAQLNIPLLNLLITQPCREVWRVELKMKNYNKLKDLFKCLKANYELLQLSRINKYVFLFSFMFAAFRRTASWRLWEQQHPSPRGWQAGADRVTYILQHAQGTGTHLCGMIEPCYIKEQKWKQRKRGSESFKQFWPPSLYLIAPRLALTNIEWQESKRFYSLRNSSSLLNAGDS